MFKANPHTIFSLSCTRKCKLGYYRMTREELDKIFQLSDDKSGRGRYGFFETEKEMELLYVDGEVNPKLLEELK